MSYIGRSPQIGGYHKLDAITTDGSASYTMQLNSANFTPESANHLIVSVNGVIQAPVDSFTVSASTITFASTLSVSDTIDFIMALGNTLDIGTPSDGTISASKLATTSITGQTAETSANDSDSLLIYDDSATALRKMTRANFLSGVGGAMTPYFQAKLSAGQTFSNNVSTKIQFDTENYDSGGCYDNSTNYRFTPTTAGKYYIYLSVGVNALAPANLQNMYAFIKKNGSDVGIAHQNYNSNDIFFGTCNLSMILTFNGSSDYVEAFVQGSDASGSAIVESSHYSIFGGYKIIE